MSIPTIFKINSHQNILNRSIFEIDLQLFCIVHTEEVPQGRAEWVVVLVAHKGSE